jgi:hypothetical protein
MVLLVSKHLLFYVFGSETGLLLLLTMGWILLPTYIFGKYIFYLYKQKRDSTNIYNTDVIEKIGFDIKSKTPTEVTAQHQKIISNNVFPEKYSPYIRETKETEYMVGKIDDDNKTDTNDEEKALLRAQVKVLEFSLNNLKESIKNDKGQTINELEEIITDYQTIICDQEQRIAKYQKILKETAETFLAELKD